MKSPIDSRRLLAPVCIRDFEPDSYRQYVKDLYKPYKSSKAKAVPQTVNISRNKKGSIVFRIRRVERFLLKDEAIKAAKALEMKLVDFEQLCMERKIPIKEQ